MVNDPNRPQFRVRPGWVFAVIAFILFPGLSIVSNGIYFWRNPAENIIVSIPFYILALCLFLVSWVKDALS